MSARFVGLLDEFNKVFETLTSHGWLEREEAWLLYRMAARTTGAIVEVGSYQGRSAVLLASFGRPLHCVDPWDDNFHDTLTGEEIYQKFLANTKSFSNIIPHRCKVEEWNPVPAELVYLDGDHSYEGTVAQVRKALACGPKVIAIHDVNNSGGGVLVRDGALKVLGRKWDMKIGNLAAWELG